MKQVTEYIKKLDMIHKGDRIVLGLSGGADSVCLFYILYELQKELSFQLAAVHVEHGLRGEEAKEDAAFAKQLCDKAEIPIFIFHKDVISYAAQNQMSLEEAGRMVRYNTFAEVCAKWAGNKIAVAHHKNDLAETMLFHLFRGAGLQGLRGMIPIRDNIIRPLLCIGRIEIEEYLKERQILYRVDSTNLENIYARNKIRMQIIPAAESINIAAVNNMAEAAKLLGEAEDYIKHQSMEAAKQCVYYENQMCYIQIKDFINLHVMIQRYIVYACIEYLSGSRKDITGSHIEAVLSYLQKDSGKQLFLPYEILVKKDYDKLVFYQNQEQKEVKFLNIPISIPGKIMLPDGRSMELSIEHREKDQIIPENRYTKWFDYDTIKNSLCLRYRNQGDYLCINDALQKKSLKAYFIHEKISSFMRNEIPLLAEDNHIIWIIGYRISAAYKVTDFTKRLLKVHISGGSKDE